MNLLFWGITLGVIGKVIVVLAVLHMHHSLVKENKINHTIYLTYRQERVLTFLGLFLILIGYAMEVYFYSPTALFNCSGINCPASLNSALLSQ